MTATWERFFDLRDEPGCVCLTRTAAAFGTLEEMRSTHEAVVAELDSRPRRKLGILVDLRLAPPRNDPEFEEAIAPYRRAIFQGFVRRVIVVRTVVGELQVRRHANEDHHEVRFVKDPELGLALARGVA